MSSILKALQKLDRESAKSRPRDDPHSALRQLVPQKMAGRSRGLMLRNTAFAVFAAVFLGAVSWAIWRHPLAVPGSAVQRPSPGTKTALQTPRAGVPGRPLPDPNPPPAAPVPAETRPISPAPPRAPEAQAPLPPPPSQRQPRAQAEAPVDPVPSLPDKLPTVPVPPPARSRGVGGPAADTISRTAPAPPRQIHRQTAPTPDRTPPASVQPSAPAPSPPRSAAVQRTPQRATPSTGSHKEIPVKSQDEAGLTIQALVWSTEPEERLVVVNGTILKEGGMIDGASVAVIGEDHIIVNQGGSRWKVKFQLK